MSRWFLSALLALLLAACGSVEPLPEDHFYRLVSSYEPGPLANPVLDGRLLVEEPRATGVRRNRAVLYSPVPYVRFQQYNYHHWEEAPPRLVQHRLLDGLAAMGVSPTITLRAGAQVDYRLESHLVRFERLIDGDNFAALVELHVRLVDVVQPETPLVEVSLTSRKAAADGTMEASALAFGAAMDDVMAQLAAAIGGMGGEAAHGG